MSPPNNKPITIIMSFDWGDVILSPIDVIEEKESQTSLDTHKEDYGSPIESNIIKNDICIN